MSLLGNPKSFRKTADAKLNITSMMDMFTIILVFLLFSYSIDQQDLVIDEGLELPNSRSRMQYKEALKLSLTKDSIKVNDKEIVALRKGKIPKGKLDGLKVAGLYEVLVEEKKKIEANPNKKKPQEDTLVVFQADKSIAFSVIDPVMKTAGMAGFPNFRFAVMRLE
jgi:biopolymer transport protein ExbD